MEEDATRGEITRLTQQITTLVRESCHGFEKIGFENSSLTVLDEHPKYLHSTLLNGEPIFLHDVKENMIFVDWDLPLIFDEYSEDSDIAINKKLYQCTIGVIGEGSETVTEAEGTILESLSSHVRAVVATLGGQHGAARRADKWRHLYAGFTIWLSQSEATDESSAKEEARRNIQDGNQGYSNADVVVKLGGWDPNLSQTVAQACLSALKRMILSDKKLPGKKSLYVRLGCRGDWPNINPPGWDPSSSEQ
ncbi:hypothetical protein GIB67_042503 [Kingdonia uniflora]|uniref:Uncharacterized protein n=1 Tax=Kingdonia uniflora TaxID=39325 RepID=A0A7J7M167_9MAGN|nr:hypothetical protein GIB67_042503 [Kingdonia uniflora]